MAMTMTAPNAPNFLIWHCHTCQACGTLVWTRDWFWAVKRRAWSFSWKKRLMLILQQNHCLSAGLEDEEHLPWERSRDHHRLWSCQCGSEALLEVQEARGHCAGIILIHRRWWSWFWLRSKGATRKGKATFFSAALKITVKQEDFWGNFSATSIYITFPEYLLWNIYRIFMKYLLWRIYRIFTEYI